VSAGALAVRRRVTTWAWALASAAGIGAIAWVGAATADSAAAEVVLLGADGRPVTPGVLAPGRYRVEARYATGELRYRAVDLLLVGGADVTVSCEATLRRCSWRDTRATGGR
jgi:hypothetical protein